MLSIETECKLANIFLTLAEGEKSVDINRQILVELDDFDPYQIVCFIDTQQKNYINSFDLKNFLEERNIFIDELEINLIVLFYDRDYDGVLSYPEFSNFLQGEYSQKRNISNNSEQNIIPNLSNNIDQAMRQLLANEVELAQKIISLLEDLKKRYDFNIHDLYHAVKNWNFIEENGLRNFFRRNKISFLESDIRKIMKRLDFNGDGKIDLCEFHAFLGFPNCHFCCPRDVCSFCGISCCNLCVSDVPCFIHNCVHGILNNSFNNQENNINNNSFNTKQINDKNLNLNNMQNQNELQINRNKITPKYIKNTQNQRNNTPSITFGCENNDPNKMEDIKNENNSENKNIIDNNNKLNENYKNNLNFNNFKKMDNFNQDDIDNYNFNYNDNFPQSKSSNSFLGHVSENLVLRPSPKRKYSPTIFHCNPYRASICRNNDYCCNFIYKPDPCDKCILNHCNLCHKEISNEDEYETNQYTSCQICHNFPCCCCTICHFYPCKCQSCPICHSYQCKCCPKCKTFPCKCCPKCNSPQCMCCPNCKKFPCKCCPVCHLEECCCCKTCHKYPCACCPTCHFANCRCCTVCNNYPCVCCQICHMPKCICCPNCKTYPCRCCPDCHCLNCQCCSHCGCFPCRCSDMRCNCCNMCGNIQCGPCKNCNRNPCICCPYCNPNTCHIPGCNCGKQCIAANLNALNAMNCPMHNVHTMKHNPGCPYEVKCPHGPKCAHPKKDINKNQNENSLNNSNFQNNNNQFYNNDTNNNYQNNNSSNNNSQMNSDNFNNNQINNNNRYQNHCPHNKNNKNQPNSNNSSITYSYNPNPNEEQYVNDRNNNNDFNNSQSINDNYNNVPNNNASQNNNESNSNEQYNQNGPKNDGPYNQNDPNNNGPFNPNNEDNNRNNPNMSYQNQNDNRLNPNQNDNNPNNQNIPNANNSCPLSPISSPFPPNSPFFNAEEPGQKSNWIFCNKCNAYHRCPHPGCEHNPYKRTTTHKCIHDDNKQNRNNNENPNMNNSNNFPNNNMVTPNFSNNNFISFNPNIRNPSSQGDMNNSRGPINTSQSHKSKPPRKRDVFSTCPYQEELGQFVDFLGYLMEVESKIEDMKIELARREDFNFEDLFRIFEVDENGYIEPEDLKQGLKLLGLDPSDFDIKLLMKRFDLNQQGLLTYSDFFDMVVSFEKKMRNSVQIRPPNSCCPCKSPDVFECDTLIAIKNLFKFIIECERDINQIRAGFDSLRSKYSDVVQFLDYSRKGVIKRTDLKLYLTQFNKFTTSKECDLLFIRLDKTRSGEVGIDEIENELMFLR